MPANLKSDFTAWVKKQKKSNGENYSENTISNYTRQLKNATSQLTLEDNTIHTNLFLYTSYEVFEAARQKILKAPNFKIIDETTGNRAYSSGMKLYALFLKEVSETPAWIFQGNPKKYDVVGAIKDVNVITWAVNQYANQIKKGNKVYIWLSGEDAGIIASGIITCDPEMKELDPSDPYDRGMNANGGSYLAVDIDIKRKFTSYIVSRDLLIADETTQSLQILKLVNATNFRVSRAQEEIIESMIDDSYFKTEYDGSRRYWIYSPGAQSKYWELFYEEGLMGCGWQDLGYLSQYKSKEEIQSALRQKYGVETSHQNNALALWQFKNEMSIGDIVFVKRGKSTVIGCGTVASDYFYDKYHSDYKHFRKVNWTHNGIWPHPGPAITKMLTDITPYPKYIKRLKTLVWGAEGTKTQHNGYSAEAFLSEVFLSRENYATLKALLLRKQNIILQGAPGVGKTFAAKRLAFSIMAEKDENRVKVVQFHQSYSYEDFVMGFRPTEGGGFALSEGPFYTFCKEAGNDDSNRPYFFIIDEINRGNLSKIFGELLMLIECDKRGKENAIRLLYKDELFYVPGNVYIIGMMNTADRSLAMIDYALRRRFAFFDIEPAFRSEGFNAMQTKANNPKLNALVESIEALNKIIEEDASLGKGFRVGHSYFCQREDETADDEWMASVVEYELIPLLNEYWFDEPSKAEAWAANLRNTLHD